MILLTHCLIAGQFINRAWRKTETMYTFSGRRKCWSLAILLQVMKRSPGYDENETQAQSDVKKESQQSGGDPSANEPVYIRIPFSEMINGKECYRSDTVAENKESKTSETDEKDKESKTSETVAMDIFESPQIKEYKLIDKVPSPTQILQNNFYITLYDNQTRNAAWVYEILNKSTLANNNVDKRTDFIQDESVHETFRTPDGVNTYWGTGYDRGHLAAAGNHRWCQEALDDTYLLRNIIPQQHDFNSGLWNDLEEYCRVIAEGFKVIIVEKKDGKVLAPKCYKMPNKKLAQDTYTNNKLQKNLEQLLNQYKVEIKDIQRDSGLIFEEREIKEEITDETWKVHWRENPDKTGRGTLIEVEVKVSGSYTDHSDRAVLH
ncbi:hypothetical protein PO909_002581 [Leuciscus waleckii]